MTPWVRQEDYARFCPGGPPVTPQDLLRAQQEVEAICYGRVDDENFERFSLFQREKLKQAACMHALFLLRYGAMLAMPLQRRAVGVVGETIDPMRTERQGGVITSLEVMALLRQTGLASRRLPR